MTERRRYDSAEMADHPAFEIDPPDPELARRVAEAGWSDGLLARVLALRRDRAEIERWLDAGFPTAEMLDPWVDTQAELLRSTLAARQATWEDNDLLVDLCASAPEQIGDWTVTVERGPNPFAQFRLQEHPNVIVLEDQRVGLGMAAHSVRNTYIAGQRVAVHHMSGWRVRDGFRGLGLSRLLQLAAGPGVAWFGPISYWLVRSGNESRTWIDKVVGDLEGRPDGYQVSADRLTASVATFRATELGQRSAAVRPATEADLPACRDLINRTNGGLDLFRPYSEDYLDERMNDPSWGPKPDFYARIYGLDDYRVLERDGRIVACGGLWDRGRDVREIWVRGDERIVNDPAALMDIGYRDGEADAMGELVTHLLAETATLGRSGLLAAIEHLPELQAVLEPLRPVVETRDLQVTPFTSPTLTVDLAITRPYIDLAYW